MKQLKADVQVYTNENLSEAHVVDNATPLSSIGDRIYVERSAFFQSSEEDGVGMMIKDAIYKRVIRNAKSVTMKTPQVTSKIKDRPPVPDRRTRIFFSETRNLGITDSLDKTRADLSEHFRFMLPEDTIMEFFRQGTLGQKFSSILRLNRDFEDGDAKCFADVPFFSLTIINELPNR